MTRAYCTFDGAPLIEGTNAFGDPTWTCPDCGMIGQSEPTRGAGDDVATPTTDPSPEVLIEEKSRRRDASAAMPLGVSEGRAWNEWLSIDLASLIARGDLGGYRLA